MGAAHPVSDSGPEDPGSRVTPGTEAWARKFYGDPCSQEIVKVYFGDRYVTVGKQCARHFRRLAIIFEWKAPRYFKEIDDFLDDWGYNCRTIAGTSVYSNHAFGTAIDIDATRNARNGGSYTDSAIWQGARPAILQAEEEGFRWGGRFSNPDEMHFETLLTPTQIKARYKKDGTPRAWYRRRLRG